jgi:L-methionine (R)-S-oxide reductase
MTATAQQITNELNGMREAGKPLDEILGRAVELIHDANSRFHWTGIYELFPDNVLRLGPFVGAPTNHVFICVGQGVCGSAVAQKKNMNIPDVSQASNYLACSQETKSELVVLIRQDERIYAQIDIDSHEVAAFDGDAEQTVMAVADCLAVAYEDQQGNRVKTSGSAGRIAG